VAGIEWIIGTWLKRYVECLDAGRRVAAAIGVQFGAADSGLCVGSDVAGNKDRFVTEVV
jgi:hypothetical protein